MSNNLLKNKPYGNCKVQSLQGKHIFNCDEKKCKWYLDRNLADVVQKEPLVIRFNFITNGDGHINDKFYLQERDNKCVCCGSFEGLNKHHIVPRTYRKHFPDNVKNHSAYDVLPLCHKCHEAYETHANMFKRELIKEFGITEENAVITDYDILAMNKAAMALLNCEDDMSTERFHELMDIMKEFYDRDEITRDDLIMVAEREYVTPNPDYKPASLRIVEKLGSIEEFVIRWRKHFIAHTNPQYMPDYWYVDRPLNKGV